VPSSPSSLTLTSRRFSTESQLCTGGNNIYLVESPPEYCGPDTYHLSHVTSLGCVALRRQLNLTSTLVVAVLRRSARGTQRVAWSGCRAEQSRKWGFDSLYIWVRKLVSPAGRSVARDSLARWRTRRRRDARICVSTGSVPHKYKFSSLSYLWLTLVHQIRTKLQYAEAPVFQLSLIILLRLLRFLEAYKYTRDLFFVATYPSVVKRSDQVDSIHNMTYFAISQNLFLTYVDCWSIYYICNFRKAR